MINPFEARLMLNMAWDIVCRDAVNPHTYHSSRAKLQCWRSWDLYVRALGASPPI